MRLIECVPNFSEGQNPEVIKAIADAIKSVEGVKLLHTDSGYAANRTVYTFVGEPERVCEAAFRSVECAKKVIDMRFHKGEHPRQGVCDVLPLVPVSEVTMEECVEYARKLAMRIGGALNIPVYCYEEAAFSEKRRNLADCRKGEYEGLRTKIYSEEWKPDFGFTDFSEEVARSGASVVGARNFLIAVNFNLNTTSAELATELALDIREKGRKHISENGDVITEQGAFKGVKALGWYIKEYGIAQVTMNITDIDAAPLHLVWEALCEKAQKRGLRVTGTEIIGLVPRKVLTDAGRYFLKKQNRPWGTDEAEQIKIAVKSMSLDDLCPFDPKEKIIEYLLENDNSKDIISQTVECFSRSEKIVKEGVTALLISSVAARTIAKRVYRYAESDGGSMEKYSMLSHKCHEKADELLSVTEKFDRIMEKINNAQKLPQKTERQIEIFDETLTALKKELSVTGVNAMSSMCDVIGLTDSNFTQNDDMVNSAFGYLHTAIYDIFGVIKRIIPEEEDADTVLDTFLSVYDGYFDKFEEVRD